MKDLFAVDGFFCVKGKLAELLKEFDLGEDELVEFPIYEMDKTTRLPGPFYFLNFGSQTDCLLPKESKKLKAGPKNPTTGFQRWRAIEPNDWDIAVSASALDGADLWADPKLKSALFISGPLHDAIEAAQLGIDFSFVKARIV